MKFIALVKWKGKPTKEWVEETLRMQEVSEKIGIRPLSVDWTLGRYNAIIAFEAPDEKAVMRNAIAWGDLLDMETLVAIPVEEARKLVE